MKNIIKNLSRVYSLSPPKPPSSQASTGFSAWTSPSSKNLNFSESKILISQNSLKDSPYIRANRRSSSEVCNNYKDITEDKESYLSIKEARLKEKEEMINKKEEFFWNNFKISEIEDLHFIKIEKMNLNKAKKIYEARQRKLEEKLKETEKIVNEVKLKEVEIDEKVSELEKQSLLLKEEKMTALERLENIKNFLQKNILELL